MPIMIPGFPEPVFTFEEAVELSRQHILRQAEILREELRAKEAKRNGARRNAQSEIT